MGPMFGVFVVAALVWPSAHSLGWDRSVRVTGQALCHGKGLQGLMVNMYDNDWLLDPDDLMGATKTDTNGNFTVEGITDSVTQLDPEVYIYFKCGDAKACHKFPVPEKYITKGEKPEETYDMKVLVLEEVDQNC